MFVFKFKVDVRVEFENVIFVYNFNERFIFNCVSFIVEFGIKVAFVGRFGVGKSMISKFIYCFYDI